MSSEPLKTHVKQIEGRRKLQTVILAYVENAQSDSSILSQLKRVLASWETS